MTPNRFFVWAFLIAIFLGENSSAAGSIGLLGGTGSFSSGSWGVSSYGISISGRREKPEGERTGELALSYLSHSVGHPQGQVTLSTYALDLRRRYSGQFGFFIGMDIAYFSSGNENLVSSGIGVAPQLGYDLPLGGKASLGLQGQWYFGRSFPSLLLTFKLSK
jgi:hypothetical protein